MNSQELNVIGAELVAGQKERLIPQVFTSPLPVRNNLSRDQIIQQTYQLILTKNQDKKLTSHRIQEIAECVYYQDSQLPLLFDGHRAAGIAIRQYHESLRKHPFADEQDRRYSAGDIVRSIQDPRRICACGERNRINPQLDQPSYPKFTDCTSTADVFTCETCGRVWEEAYTYVYSMCILKSGSQDEI